MVKDYLSRYRVDKFECSLYYHDTGLTLMINFKQTSAEVAMILAELGRRMMSCGMTASAK